jgi:hypothetical protein
VRRHTDLLETLVLLLAGWGCVALGALVAHGIQNWKGI